MTLKVLARRRQRRNVLTQGPSTTGRPDRTVTLRGALKALRSQDLTKR
jgi:hypothetical protein